MTAPGRHGMRRAIIILPGAFTAGNLFFGIWAIVEASRGNFVHAAWYIVFAGILDTLDGRVARISRTGTQFGAEMDSLVDAVSFGVAPGLLVYFHTFRSSGDWAWVISFLFALAAVLRLARFNIEQAGHAKSQFFGLPSPAAGMTLATWYPFSQTPLFQHYLAGLLPWNRGLAVLMLGMALLMVSHVPYPIWPKVGWRDWRGRFGIAYSLGALAGMVYVPRYFFFLYGIAYLSFGLGRAAVYGFLDRLPERDPLHDDEESSGRPVDDARPALLPFRVRRPRRRTGGAP